MEIEQELRVVYYQEDERWVAQCLEYDIGAQAESLSELAMIFGLTLRMEQQESLKRHGTPFAGIDPAPEYFQKMWENRSGGFLPVVSDDGGVPHEIAMYA